MVLFFLMISSTLLVHTNTSIHLLLSAELLWITLYVFALFAGMIYDNMNLLGLTFFFLILSAVEFSVGLVVILIQHLLTRTLQLDFSGVISTNYTSNPSKSILVNRLRWKY